MAVEPTPIPCELIESLEVQDPKTHGLIIDLLSAREVGDRGLQKRIRSKLRKNGFYLSCLAQGGDPFKDKKP